jgi:hypothetical protein
MPNTAAMGGDDIAPAPLGKQAQKKRGPRLVAGTGIFKGLTDSKWQARTYAIIFGLTILSL